jgi:hypothetical protein
MARGTEILTSRETISNMDQVTGVGVSPDPYGAWDREHVAERSKSHAS